MSSEPAVTLVTTSESDKAKARKWFERAKTGYGAMAGWMGSMCGDTLYKEKKASAGRFEALCSAIDALGEAAQRANAFALAFDAYGAMIRISEVWKRQHPQSQEASRAYG